MKNFINDKQLAAKVHHLIGIWEYAREQGLQTEHFKLLARRAKEVALTLQSKNETKLTNNAILLVKELYQSYKEPHRNNQQKYIKIDQHMHSLEQAILKDEKTHHLNVRSKGKVLSLSEEIQDQKLQKQLQDYGFEIIKKDTQQIENDHIRAIIIDNKYCEANTTETLTNELDQRPSFFSTPIIYLGAENTFIERLQAAHYKAMGFMEAPLDPHKLIEQIERLSMFVDEPYRVLMCDDSSKPNASLMQYVRKSGFMCKVITSPLLVNRTLVEYNPDLVFINVSQVDANGFEIARIIRQQENYMNLPIIMLTQEFDYNEQFQSLKIGCPYIQSSPIDKAGVLAISAAWSQRSRILKSQLAKDSLTGLLNHSRTLEQLEIELSRQARYNTPLSFAMLDIDNFKSINDTYGHTAGDIVIKSMAQLLKMRLRKTDIVGRYGGEEFAVILPNTDKTKAQAILTNIRKDFSQIEHQHGKKRFNITFSGGVSSTENFEKPTANKLTESADGALYKSKGTGKNKILIMEE